jgi:transposase-like protein
VIDGAKALRKAVRNVFGEAPVQRCLRHYADFWVMPTLSREAWSAAVIAAIGSA